MRRRRWRIAAIVGPFAAGYLVLFAIGTDVEAILARFFAGGDARSLPEREGVGLVFYGNEAAAVANRDDLLAFWRAAAESRWGREWSLRRPEHLALRIFETREQFLEFGERETQSSLENNGAYFNPVKMDIVCVGQEGVVARDTLFHEGMHALCHRTGMDMPGWLGEGLAQYVESFVSADKPGGIPVALAREALEHLKTRRCADVMDADDEEFRAAGNRVPYLLSHAIVATLMDTEPDRFVAFVKAHGWRPDRPYQVFANFFGADYNLDLNVKNYLEGRVSHGN